MRTGEATPAELDALRRELAEARAEQAAVARVLQTVNASAFDLDAVLATIIYDAVRLSDSDGGTIFTYRDGQLGAAATAGRVDPIIDASVRERRTFAPHRGVIPGRVVLDRTLIHILDVRLDDGWSERAREQARLGGIRTALGLPILRGDEVVGVFSLRRTDVRAYGDREISLMRTFADQAAIAIENVRLFNETKEALERQTAISEILRVISASPTDVRPVLDAIAQSAMRFCAAEHAIVNLIDGSMIRPVAGHLSVTEPFPLDRTTVTGRSMVDVRTYSIRDLADPSHASEFPLGHAQSLRSGERAIVATPMVREGRSIGGIVLWRVEPYGFTDKQTQLVETFAQQAAIAIENVRLFNETKEALAQQTATSEVLQSISRSAFDLDAVLRTVLERARDLCEAEHAMVVRATAEGLRLVAYAGSSRTLDEQTADQIATGRPYLLGPGDEAAVTGRRSVQLTGPELAADVERSPRGFTSHTGVQARLSVPLLRGDDVLGLVVLGKMRPTGFSAREVALVETFADQAVIAIENVRLFNETKQALDRQTATAEILRAISSSPTDVQPVLDAIAASAVRYCGAESAGIMLLHEGRASAIANAGVHVEGDVETMQLEPSQRRVVLRRDRVWGRAILDRASVQVPDVLDPAAIADFPDGLGGGRAAALPYRAVLVTPLRRQDEAIGGLSVQRKTPGPFTAEQIALVEVFASQAVIAIENVRLFNETKEALEQQTATAEVLQVISRSAFDLQPVFDTVVDRSRRLCDADAAWMNVLEKDGTASRFSAVAAPSPDLEAFRDSYPLGRLVPIANPPRNTVMARAFRGELIHVDDIAEYPEHEATVSFAGSAGARTVLGVPMRHQDRALGGIVVIRRTVRPFSEREIQLVRTFADQAAIAIENVRLFNEIQDKSRQLEVASRHKSEFLANMSHELRTPLNAIIGFTDVMLQEMFGPLNEKQKEYLDDVRTSGNHLLTLINDILDLSKIEAGRVDLELGEFSVAEAIENALTLVRERAARHSITIAADIGPEVGGIVGDQRKVKQILVNLLSNAVKFTPDGGWVGITAKCDGEHVDVAVRDTGIGIAPEDQARVFEEFQQVGKDPDKSREGTGLGLALAKRYVELHGGRIWVESEVGKGSTFTFSIPVRQTAAATAKG